MFLDKFVQRITPEYMSQRDFLICVANDAFWAQVDVFGDWTIKIMATNAVDNTIYGSYRPMRVLQFYFNAQHRGNSPTQFNEEIASIDFPEEVSKYTAVIISVRDQDHTGLHLYLRTESQSKPTQANRPLRPKSTKVLKH